MFWYGIRTTTRRVIRGDAARRFDRTERPHAPGILGAMGKAVNRGCRTPNHGMLQPTTTRRRSRTRLACRTAHPLMRRSTLEEGALQRPKARLRDEAVATSILEDGSRTRRASLHAATLHAKRAIRARIAKRSPSSARAHDARDKDTSHISPPRSSPRPAPAPPPRRRRRGLLEHRGHGAAHALQRVGLQRQHLVRERRNFIRIIQKLDAPPPGAMRASGFPTCSPNRNNPSLSHST